MHRREELRRYRYPLRHQQVVEVTLTRLLFRNVQSCLASRGIRASNFSSAPPTVVCSGWTWSATPPTRRHSSSTRFSRQEGCPWST
eukprot:scaffold172270_cov41-Prasinocladus_malaysianus.AAC.2